MIEQLNEMIKTLASHNLICEGKIELINRDLESNCDLHLKGWVQMLRPSYMACVL